MFKNLKSLFDAKVKQIDSDKDKAFTDVELAAAVLLVEIAYADDEFSDIEEQRLEYLLHQEFHINHALIKELITTARQAHQDSIDHYQFTRHITLNYDYDGRCKVLSALWQMAYADQQLDAMEEHRIRHIAELLSIDHSDFIRLKLKARDES